MTLSFSDYLRMYPYYIIFQALSLARSVYVNEHDIVGFTIRQVDDVTAILQQLDFVGVTERLNESGSMISALMFGGADLRIPRLNSSRSHGVDHAAMDELIAEYHALRGDPDLAPYFDAEQKVYEKAKSLMDASYAAIESSQALSVKQASGYLPANAFHSVTGRRNDRCYEAPLGDRVEYLIYGPYESLEIGEYDIEFHISISGSAKQSRGSLWIDVTAHQTQILAKKTIRGAPTAARSRLRFTNRDSRDVLEYRVSGVGYGGGVLKFEGVTIRPVRRPAADFLSRLLRLGRRSSPITRPGR